MPNSKNNKDPMHGITLEMKLRDVIDLHGYKELAKTTKIKSFEQKGKPIMKPILKFIRKAAWAREEIEYIYLRDIDKIAAMKASKSVK